MAPSRRVETPRSMIAGSGSSVNSWNEQNYILEQSPRGGFR